MTRKARRASLSPRFDALESRALMSADASISGPWAATPAVSAASSILLRFSAGTTQAQQQADLDAVGGRVAATFPNGPTVVALPPWANRDAALATLSADAGIVYAEANSTIHSTGYVVPSDPSYSSEWGMPVIDAPVAWSLTTGSPSTIVAVLDTGIDLSSPEFSGRIWVNPVANTDGFTGDVNGWNFVNNTGNVQDNNGHGTHVSGIIAAKGNNGVGVAGVDWNTQIMPLKVLDSQGDGSTSATINAIYFAVNHGAKVINASWGGDVFSQGVLDALNYANAHGVVFVTAAGNDGSNNNLATTYPASYRTPNELVVAALNQNGTLASFSNYGPTTVDLAAPGVGIVSSVPGGLASYDGTSMSAAFVSGAVAMAAGAHPNLNAGQLVNLMRDTVKPLASLNGRLISPGVVDVYYALIGHQTFGQVSASSTPSVSGNSSSFEDVEAAVLSTDSVYNAFGGTPNAYAINLYRALDNRDPSQAEMTSLASSLLAGITRSTLVNQLQDSTEGLTTKVARWYRDELGVTTPIAALKADGAVQHWANLLASGVSDTQVQAQIFASDGFYNGAGGTPAAFVATLYVELLGRAPDVENIPYYTSELAAGRSRAFVVQQFLNSPEGKLTLMARLYSDDLGWPQDLATLKANSGVGYWSGYLGSS